MQKPIESVKKAKQNKNKKQVQTAIQSLPQPLPSSVSPECTSEDQCAHPSLKSLLLFSDLLKEKHLVSDLQN